MAKYECNRCKQTFLDIDAIEVCTFWGSREEPPEYDYKCPHCDSNDLEEIEGEFCVNCGDVEVKHEGDSCAECIVCAAEIESDRRKDELSLTEHGDAEWQQEREEMARMPEK